MIKINFKQPKYIFPLVIFVPLCALVYFVMQTFSGGEETAGTVATDRINMELPQANAEEAGDKMYEMSRRFGDEDAFTAVGGIGEEKQTDEELEHGYSEEELNRLDAAEAERLRQQREMEELERSLAESKRHINSYAYGNNASHRTAGGTQGSGVSPDYTSQEDFARDLEEIQRRSYERQKAIEKGLGFGSEDAEEAAQKQRADSIAKVRQTERERNRPNLVIKSSDTNADKFHTVTASEDAVEAKLIRAMIDQTTKAKEGTRLRFNAAGRRDGERNETAERDLSLWYGVGLRTAACTGHHHEHSGWGQVHQGEALGVRQRRMEGFYVPESAFRDFVKDAGSSTVQQNISFESENGYGSGISGEAIALQALQNMYNSATSAISSNIRKNKAKIKYNTIVYLINSEDAR